MELNVIIIIISMTISLVTIIFGIPLIIRLSGKLKTAVIFLICGLFLQVINQILLILDYSKTIISNSNLTGQTISSIGDVIIFPYMYHIINFLIMVVIFISIFNLKQMVEEINGSYIKKR